MADYRIISLGRKGEEEKKKQQIGIMMAQFLRDVDRREMRAYLPDNISEEQECIDSLLDSEESYYAVDKNGSLICMWGIVNHYESGSPMVIWCVGTDKVKTVPFSFARRSRDILWRWQRQYGTLTNCVGVFNRDTVHWLKWCGAHFDTPIRAKRGDDLFQRFWLDDDCQALAWQRKEDKRDV